MKKRLSSVLLAVLTAVIFSGCADKRVAIYQVGADSGFGLFGDLVASGCVVEVKGEPTGLFVKYKDEKCDVQFGQEPSTQPTDTGDI